MLVSVAELVSASLDPAWADEQTDAQCLVVDLEGSPTLSPEELQTLAAWIRALPIPVVGLGGEGEPLAVCMDALAEADQDLQAITGGIEANPEAAAVLVQVLRSTESLDVIQALTVESLAYATLQSGAEFADWLGRRRQRKTARVLAATDPVVLVDRADSTLNVVLNSPATRNSLSTVMRDGLTQAFRLVAMDPSIDRVEVSANGPSFCAGGDLEEFGLVENPATAHRVRMLRMPALYLAPAADRYRFSVHGACIGAGIELPAFAGHLTASPDAVFRLPEIGMGLIPGAGGCVSIPRRIGRQRTALMALTGRDIDAAQALEWGLIDEIA